MTGPDPTTQARKQATPPERARATFRWERKVARYSSSSECEPSIYSAEARTQSRVICDLVGVTAVPGGLFVYGRIDASIFAEHRTES
jgi:hypothetical protein